MDDDSAEIELVSPDKWTRISTLMAFTVGTELE